MKKLFLYHYLLSRAIGTMSGTRANTLSNYEPSLDYLHHNGLATDPRPMPPNLSNRRQLAEMECAPNPSSCVYERHLGPASILQRPVRGHERRDSMYA